jgi:hypothetical protein
MRKEWSGLVSARWPVFSSGDGPRARVWAQLPERLVAQWPGSRFPCRCMCSRTVSSTRFDNIPLSTTTFSTAALRASRLSYFLHLGKRPCGARVSGLFRSLWCGQRRSVQRWGIWVVASESAGHTEPRRTHSATGRSRRRASLLESQTREHTHG